MKPMSVKDHAISSPASLPAARTAATNAPASWSSAAATAVLVLAATLLGICLSDVCDAALAWSKEQVFGFVDNCRIWLRTDAIPY